MLCFLELPAHFFDALRVAIHLQRSIEFRFGILLAIRGSIAERQLITRRDVVRIVCQQRLKRGDSCRVIAQRRFGARQIESRRSRRWIARQHRGKFFLSFSERTLFEQESAEVVVRFQQRRIQGDRFFHR